MPNLSISLGSLTLSNPILVAAGTFGYGLEFTKAVNLEKLGALVTKTLTPKPRDGNPPPRLIETPSGMLNAVGLQNIGIDAFISEKLPQLEAFDVPVIVSVLGESEVSLVEMVQKLDRAKKVAAIEINLSCPNVKRPLQSEDSSLQSLRMVAQDAEATRAMVKSARAHTQKPLIAKLTPDVTDIRPIAQAAEAAGATALTIGNTFTGMSIDPQTQSSRLGRMSGGLSGPAIRPLALYRVWYIAQAVSIPIIGLGGIVRPEDALEFFLAGASAVAIGTANFMNPKSPLKVLDGLTKYMARRQIDSIEHLVGKVKQQTT